MAAYFVKKVLNNNVVVAWAPEDGGSDVIVTGRSIGFRHRAGDALPPTEIGKVYAAQDRTFRHRFQTMVDEIPFGCVRAAEEIMDVARESLGTDFNQNLVLSLSDHISFAVSQCRAGAYQGTLLNDEIASFYPREHAVGVRAIGIIEAELGVRLGDSEASSIAFHLINNSEAGGNAAETTRIILGVEGMLEIIERDLGVDFPRDSLRYLRLVTHLKFLMRRIASGTTSRDDTSSLFLNPNEEMVRGISRCLDDVASYLRDEHKYELTNAERLYLLLHIAVLLQED